MTFEDRFPLRCCINLDVRPDRLDAVRGQFRPQKLEVERVSAVDQSIVRRWRKKTTPGQYACQLSHRLILRRARMAKVPAVAIFEDDVILHGDFRHRLETVDPPEDWGILLFGCTHVRRPVPVKEGWVRVKEFWGTHALGVRDDALAAVLKELRREHAPGTRAGIDNALSRLADRIPIYAAWPILAWQADGFSDLWAENRQRFTAEGRQLYKPELLSGL